MGRYVIYDSLVYVEEWSSKPYSSFTTKDFIPFPVGHIKLDYIESFGQDFASTTIIYILNI